MEKNKSKVNLIFPHQLFSESKLIDNGCDIYLIEEYLFFRQYKFKKKDFINAEYYYENCLSLPMFAGLKMNSQKKVIRIVRNLFIKN